MEHCETMDGLLICHVPHFCHPKTGCELRDRARFKVADKGILRVMQIEERRGSVPCPSMEVRKEESRDPADEGRLSFARGI